MSGETRIDGSFSIRLDRDKARVTMEITGLWQHSTVDRWESALAKFFSGLGPGRDLNMLVDVRRRIIHAKDVAARVQDRVAWIAPHFTRIAVLLPDSALLTLQSRRIAAAGESCEQQRFFSASEFAAADAWLAEILRPVMRGASGHLSTSATGCN
jgi:hypothetical protein